MGSSSERFQSSGAYISQEALKLSGGCVNVLVNNAGVYFPMSLDEGPNKGQGPLDGEPNIESCPAPRQSRPVRASSVQF